MGVKSTSFRAERGRVPLQNCEEGDEQAFFFATKSVSVDSSRETNSLQSTNAFTFLVSSGAKRRSVGEFELNKWPSIHILNANDALLQSVFPNVFSVGIAKPFIVL